MSFTIDRDNNNVFALINQYVIETHYNRFGKAISWRNMERITFKRHHGDISVTPEFMIIKVKTLVFCENFISTETFT